MKLTWFGEQTFRLHLGGKVTFIHNGALPHGIDATEAGAGADRVIDLANHSLEQFKPADITRAPKRLIDRTSQTELNISVFADGVCLIAPDEPPLFISPSADAKWGRFADNAIIVLTNTGSTMQSLQVFQTVSPKLLIFAVPEMTEPGFTALAASAGRSSMQFLDIGLALEA